MSTTLESLEKRLSRRKLVTGGVAFAAGSAALLMGAREASANQDGHDRDHKDGHAHCCAIQQIEYLRRLYAAATDILGSNPTQEDIDLGREIYHYIFTPDVKIWIGPFPVPTGTPPLRTGPDQWVDLVTGALGGATATQHLIGTQVVKIEQMPWGHRRKGRAVMQSYLQAWQVFPATDPKVPAGYSRLSLFIGSYTDKVCTTPHGWKIYEMVLTRVSGEQRYITNSLVLPYVPMV